MRISLFTFLLAISFSFISKGQLSSQKYKVTAYTDSIGKVKGALQTATADGITIEDVKGNRVFLSPNILYKIKIRRQTITAGQGFVVGAIAGLAGGAAIMFKDNADDVPLKAVAAAGIGTLGAMFGAIVGAIVETANTKLVLFIKNDPLYYKSNFKKLEKYAKSNAVDTPVKLGF